MKYRLQFLKYLKKESLKRYPPTIDKMIIGGYLSLRYKDIIFQLSWLKILKASNKTPTADSLAPCASI